MSTIQQGCEFTSMFFGTQLTHWLIHTGAKLIKLAPWCIELEHQPIEGFMTKSFHISQLLTCYLLWPFESLGANLQRIQKSAFAAEFSGPSHEVHVLITLVHSGNSASRKVVKFWSPSTISFHCAPVSWWVGDLKGDLNLLPLGSRWAKLIQLGVHLGIAKWRVPRLVILSSLHFPFD